MREEPALPFVLVGAAGFALQLAAVTALTSAAGWESMPATALAVELAVLHNFCWHEHWTWRARVANRAGRLHRFVRFQLATGTISLTGNLVFSTAAANVAGLNPVAANAVAVGVMAIANFHLADRWVFLKT